MANTPPNPSLLDSIGLLKDVQYAIVSDKKMQIVDAGAVRVRSYCTYCMLMGFSYERESWHLIIHRKKKHSSRTCCGECADRQIKLFELYNLVEQ